MADVNDSKYTESKGDDVSRKVVKDVWSETTSNTNIPQPEPIKQNAAKAKYFEEPARILLINFKKEIIQIADIDDIQDEAKLQELSEAPAARVMRVQNIDELKGEGAQILPDPEDKGIDLSILTSYFISADNIKEDDKYWEFESVLQEVAQGMNKIKTE